MQQIDYSSHWNWKLANKSFFTTIRLNSSKYRQGEIYKHVFKDFSVEAALVKIDVRRWNDFSEFELALDTGYNREESEKIFKSFYPTLNFATQDFSYMLFKKIVNEKQGRLFG